MWNRNEPTGPTGNMLFEYKPNGKKTPYEYNCSHRESQLILSIQHLISRTKFERFLLLALQSVTSCGLPSTTSRYYSIFFSTCNLYFDWYSKQKEIASLQTAHERSAKQNEEKKKKTVNGRVMIVLVWMPIKYNNPFELEMLQLFWRNETQTN